MRSWITVTVLFLVMLGILACRTTMTGTMTRAIVIPHKPGPYFDHDGHLGRGVECVECVLHHWRQATPTRSGAIRCVGGSHPPRYEVIRRPPAGAIVRGRYFRTPGLSS